MRLTLSDDLVPLIRDHLSRIAPRLTALLPQAEFHHVGTTAIPGALTKGDVDVELRVDGAGFPAAVEILRKKFATKQPENWTDTFASFGDDSSYPFPLGVQLVVKESANDIFLYLHDYFVSDAQHLAEYNRLKREFAPLGPEAYWRAKDRFLSSVLASRIPRG